MRPERKKRKREKEIDHRRDTSSGRKKREKKEPPRPLRQPLSQYASRRTGIFTGQGVEAEETSIQKAANMRREEEGGKRHIENKISCDQG